MGLMTGRLEALDKPVSERAFNVFGVGIFVGLGLMVSFFFAPTAEIRVLLLVGVVVDLLLVAMYVVLSSFRKSSKM